MSVQSIAFDPEDICGSCNHIYREHTYDAGRMPCVSTMTFGQGACPCKMFEPLVPVPLRPLVDAFARRMEFILAKNDYKGGSWREASPEWLLARLIEEAGELAKEVLKGRWKAGTGDRTKCGDFQARLAIQNEAADVANYAMFIAAVCQQGPFHLTKIRVTLAHEMQERYKDER